LGRATRIMTDFLSQEHLVSTIEIRLKKASVLAGKDGAGLMRAFTKKPINVIFFVLDAMRKYMI